MSYVKKKFPKEYVPTIFDNYTADVEVNGKPIHLGLWDTAGQEDYDKLRPLSYHQTDVVLVCFSVDSQTSFTNVEQKWVLELQRYAPEAVLLLVGTKLDLRPGGGGAGFITKEQGETLRAKIKAAKYLECSALNPELNGNGLKAVFDEAIRTVLSARTKPKKSKCLILWSCVGLTKDAESPEGREGVGGWGDPSIIL